MLPYLFATDHVHYLRWLSIHLADLKQLLTKCANVYDEFVTLKTKNRVSALAHDQVHEQLNAIVKGEGGAIGLLKVIVSCAIGWCQVQRCQG